jgi:transcriptional regulator with XRE-family HTH domain
MPSDLGERLRLQRESRGLTLDAVALATKIKVSLLADLERNDLSRWPDGIYGRGFLRAYARAIGLSPGLLPDYLFETPGEGADASRSSAAVPTAGADAAVLRLTLAGKAVKPRVAAAQAADAAIVLAVVLAVGGVVAAAAGVTFLTATAVVALTWYPAAHVLFGGVSPVRSLRNWRQPSPGKVPGSTEAGPSLPILPLPNRDGDAIFVAGQRLQQVATERGAARECARGSGARHGRSRTVLRQVSHAPNQAPARSASRRGGPSPQRRAIAEGEANEASGTPQHTFRKGPTKPS